MIAREIGFARFACGSRRPTPVVCDREISPEIARSLSGLQLADALAGRATDDLRAVGGAGGEPFDVFDVGAAPRCR